MSFIVEQLRSFSVFLHPYQDEISMAMVATVLVIYGNDLNRLVKKEIKNNNFLIRYTVFVLVSAFAYGMVTVFASKVLTRLINMLDTSIQCIAIIAVFLLLGFLAERKNHI